MNRPAIDQQITFLAARDLAKTAEFYENILGLRLVLDQGGCRIYETAPNAYIGFCHQLSTQQQPHAGYDGIMLTLVTTAVDDWHTYLTAKNVPIEKPPTHNPTYNIYQMFVRDPNGYIIEIQSFLDSTWPPL
jgi:catechol 2,3-dioxygenase-like lactoylglutathione lyase family enzyme